MDIGVGVGQSEWLDLTHRCLGRVERIAEQVCAALLLIQLTLSGFRATVDGIGSHVTPMRGISLVSVLIALGLCLLPLR